MKRNLIVLSVLVLVFSLPWMIAYQLSKHPQWLQKFNPTNYGTWIKRDVRWEEKADNQRSWQLVFWQDGACDLACFKQIDLLGRIRLAMGRKVMLTNIWLFLPKDYPLSQKELNDLKEHDVLVAYADQKQQRLWAKEFSTHPIVLFSPENKALLMYNANSEPKRIYHDFQRLIK